MLLSFIPPLSPSPPLPHPLALWRYAISHAQNCTVSTYGPQVQIDICAEREEGESVATPSQARHARDV